MNIRWVVFVNQYDTSRYVPASDGRDNWYKYSVRSGVCQRGVCSSSMFFKYVFRLSVLVVPLLTLVLQDKTNSIIDLYKDILRAVEDLATCSYTTEAFSELLGRVQAAVCYWHNIGTGRLIKRCIAT